MLDGHVERVAYKLLWKLNAVGDATHSVWWLDVKLPSRSRKKPLIPEKE